jgi:GT2 family glycosyltransferase
MKGISVVIPTKDRLPYLRKTVPMFLAQEEVKELVIVVDGCRDATLEYVEAASARDGRIRYVDNVTNRGLPWSRNRGIELAEYDYVFTGEDDLEVSENFFATLLAHIETSGADIISGRNIFRHETESHVEAIARTNKATGPSVNRRTLSFDPGINTKTDQEQPLLPAPMLARTDIFRKVKYDDSFRGNAWREETDFQLRAYETGYKLVYCPHAITFNIVIENDRGGVHSTGQVKRVSWVIRNNWQFINKNREMLAREFEIGSPRIYIAKFAIKRIFIEIILPAMVIWKRRLFATVRGSSA